VPWRRYYAAAFAGLTIVVGVLLFVELRRVVAWMVVAGFFAVVLAPAVGLVEQHLHVRRGLAVTITVVFGAIVVSGLVALIVIPLVAHATDFAVNLSNYVADTRAGRGSLGGLVRQINLDRWIQDHQQDIQNSANSLGASSLQLLRAVGNFVIASITIFVLTVLLLIQGPSLVNTTLGLVPLAHRDRVRRVGADCGRAVTGYVVGNLIIGVIAGTASYVCLRASGVPFAEVLALWVGFADLIPLVGATIGAAPAVLAAFLHSVPVGIVVIAFFVIYQQFENHVLQVTIMARTVQLNPLAVLLSVLIGVELFGLLGALLAIPAGGVVQILVREVWQFRFRPDGGAAAPAEPDEYSSLPATAPPRLAVQLDGRARDDGRPPLPASSAKSTALSTVPGRP
jgi:predicted PurR-regulated permease PerM